MSEEEEPAYVNEEEEEPKPKPKKQTRNTGNLDEFVKQERKKAGKRKVDDDERSNSSSSSRQSTAEEKADPGYLTPDQRRYILHGFTIPQLRNMSTKKGRSPKGTSKSELVSSAAKLAKTRNALLDFILSSLEDDDSDE